MTEDIMIPRAFKFQCENKKGHKGMNYPVPYSIVYFLNSSQFFNTTLYIIIIPSIILNTMQSLKLSGALLNNVTYNNFNLILISKKPALTRAYHHCQIINQSNITRFKI